MHYVVLMIALLPELFDLQLSSRNSHADHRPNRSDEKVLIYKVIPSSSAARTI